MKPALASLIVTAAVLLAGCGADADPPPTPATSTTTSVAPTQAGPVEPTPPPHAYDDTKAGVIAFAKYYFAVVDFSQQSGDTTLLKTLEAPGCAACVGGRRAIERVAQEGGHFVGGEHRVSGGRAVGFSPKGSGIILRVRTLPSRIIGAGPQSRRYAGGVQTASLAINQVGGVWRVADLDFLG
jgi:hypothetical protein